MTLLELLTRMTEFFDKRGVTPPRLAAEKLIAHQCKLSRMQLYLQFDREMLETELAPLRELTKRRADGEPLQHLLGEADFYGRTFLSDKRALIPRPETELLLTEALALATATAVSEPPLAWDIGTGSGILAVSFALEKTDWRVAAADVSEEALTLARQNAEKLGATERVTFFNSDLDSALPGSPFIIMANLPYLPSAILPTLPKDVQHDPALALDGGRDGLDIVRRLIPTAFARLKSGGWILLEIAEEQGPAVSTALQQAGYENICVKKDLAQRVRLVLGQKPAA